MLFFRWFTVSSGVGQGGVLSPALSQVTVCNKNYSQKLAAMIYDGNALLSYFPQN